VAAIFVGAVQELEAVWTFADIMNGLMALPNLVGLLALSGLIVRETRPKMAASRRSCSTFGLEAFERAMAEAAKIR
jgi:Na+/alanine symporter